MCEDAQLLRAYAADRSESAFSELIRRHMDLVYTAALRLAGGDVHCAQDVTQMVFVELARQAKRLQSHPALVGWLYTTTRLMALRQARTEQRRRAREQEAQTMNELLRDTPDEPSWESFRPVLDEAMHELGETDRLAVLLRFFKNKSLSEVGQSLGLSDNAARMRVDRALDKLRLQLARKGVTSTSAALATALGAKAVAAAPAGLAATIMTASLATAATETGALFTILKIAAMTKLQVALTTLVVAGVATTMVIQHQTRLGDENRALRQQVAQLQTDYAGLSDRLTRLKKATQPHLPAPTIKNVPSGPMEELQATNLYAKYAKGSPKLTAQQVEAYLKAHGRKALSLLAAYRSTGDKALLREAMDKFPNDPQVAFEAVLSKDLSPQEHRQWLNTFEQAAPNNSLAHYLSARDYLNSGQTDLAVQELMAASQLPYSDYTPNRMQDNEEAYLTAGYPVADSKLIGTSQVELPHLAELKKLSTQMVDLSNSYRQSGDEASAQAILQMAINLGQSYGAGDCMISHLVGMAIERNALNAMDPASAYGNTGQTVQDRLAEIARQKEALSALVHQSETLMQSMSSQDWIIYIDHVKSSGEESAHQWIVSKFGGK